MSVAFTFVLSLALAQQVTFSVLYWRWIPAWVRNPYGRLAQLGCWSLALILILALIVSATGHSGDSTAKTIYFFGFLPLLAFGFLQLDLLKKAVDSAREESSNTAETEEEVK